MKDKIILPKIPKLSENDICQGRNEQGSSKDIVGWIEHFVQDIHARHYLEKALALEIGIKSHSLIRWNDSTSKKVIVKTFNKVITSIQGN